MARFPHHAPDLTCHWPRFGWALLIALTLLSATAPPKAQAASCQFVLGFATMHSRQASECACMCLALRMQDRSDVRVPPSGAMAAAREAEQGDAARREAHIEQLQRVRAEAAAEQLQEEVERLRGKLRSTQADLKQLQEASTSSSKLASDYGRVKVPPASALSLLDLMCRCEQNQAPLLDHHTEHPSHQGWSMRIYSRQF